MIRRIRERATLAGLLTRYPVVGIVGARQIGKTTLARYLRRGMRTPPAYFDLENPEHLARLSDPMLALKGLKGLIVIDEVGYIPFEAEAANLFFQLVSARYERASAIVTSNIPVGVPRLSWSRITGIMLLSRTGGSNGKTGLPA